jgi:hypothetical protein
MRTAILMALANVVLQAGSLTSSVNGSVWSYNDLEDQVTIVSCSQMGTAGAACSDTAGPVSVNLSTHAAYGSLTSSGIVTNNTGNDGNQLDAISSFGDNLTVLSSGAASGFIAYTFHVTGYDDSSDFGLRLSVYQNGVYLGGDIPDGTGGQPIDDVVTTQMAPFVSGVPFSFSATDWAHSYFSFGDSPQDLSQANLIGISVFDASGNPLTGGYGVYSDSSTYGGLVLSPSPEPSSLTLVLLFPPLSYLALFLIRQRSGRQPPAG